MSNNTLPIPANFSVPLPLPTNFSLRSPIPIVDYTGVTPIIPTKNTVGNLYKKINDTGLYWTTSTGGEINLASIAPTTWSQYPAIQTVNLSNNKLQNLNSGGAGAPSISFNSSNTTGIYSEYANQLDISTNGLQRVSVLSNGLLQVDTANYESLVTTGNSIPNKIYVDNIAAGLTLKLACIVVTTTLLPTYIAAGSGTSKTLTSTIFGAFPNIDGIPLDTTNRILVNNAGTTNSVDTGIYTVTSLGSPTSNWVLSRAADFDDSISVQPGSFTFIEEGKVSSGSGWVLITPNPITIDVTPLTWTQFSSNGNVSAWSTYTATSNVNLGNNSIQNISAGSLSSPSISFNSSSGTGIYSGNPSQLNFVTNGANTFTINVNGLLQSGIDATNYTTLVTNGPAGSIPNKQYIYNAQATNIDSVFRVNNYTDATKQFALDLSNITTGKTVTYRITNGTSNGANITNVSSALPNATSLATGSSSYLFTGTLNTLYGVSSGTSITSGIGNTLVGYNIGSSLSTGSYNLLLGNNINTNSTATNQIVLSNASTTFTSSTLNPGTWINPINLASGSASNILYYNSTSGQVTYGSAPITGVTSVTSNLGTINVSPTTGAVVIDLPQSIATTSNVTFGSATLSTSGGSNLIIRDSGTTGYMKLVNGGNANFIQSGLIGTAGSAAALHFTDIGASNYWMTLSSTGQVGIGTTSPGIGFKLDVTGSARFTGKVTTDTLQITTSPTSGYVLTSDASGNATWQASSLPATATITTALGIGAAPATGTCLDMSSVKNKGMLLPSQTTTQRNNITSPPDGLIVYDSTLGYPMYYSNILAAWTPMLPPKILAASWNTAGQLTPITIQIPAMSGYRHLRMTWCLLADSGGTVKISFNSGITGTVYSYYGNWSNDGGTGIKYNTRTTLNECACELVFLNNNIASGSKTFQGSLASDSGAWGGGPMAGYYQRPGVVATTITNVVITAQNNAAFYGTGNFFYIYWEI